MRCMSCTIHLVVDDPVVFGLPGVACRVTCEHMLYLCSCRWTASPPVHVHPVEDVFERHLMLKFVFVAHKACDFLGDLPHPPRGRVPVLVRRVLEGQEWMLYLLN